MGLWGLIQSNLNQLELRDKGFDAALSGARVLDSNASMPGYNLYDGRLVDSAGRIIKQWPFSYLGLILPDGRYAAQEHYESVRWGLFESDGRPVWTLDLPIHHDIFYTSRNTLLTLVKETHPHYGRSVDFCAVAEFDLGGHELRRWSSWEHLAALRRMHGPLELDRPKFFFWPEPRGRKKRTPWGGQYDYYHFNSIQEIPETDLGLRDRRFAAGNWLVSARHGSLLMIIDPSSGAIVWICGPHEIAGRLEGQHAAQVLPDGRMLIFDNGRYRGWSRLIEIDPQTKRILWEYRNKGFFTRSQGYVQKLMNGNYLVTQSEEGQVFEVTSKGQRVWEFFHPDAQGAHNSLHPESYGRRQWIYRMTRYAEPQCFEAKPLADGVRKGS